MAAARNVASSAVSLAYENILNAENAENAEVSLKGSNCIRSPLRILCDLCVQSVFRDFQFAMDSGYPD